ncbi:MAG: ABC transporter ATP-binding protein [Terriglobales bacterium]
MLPILEIRNISKEYRLGRTVRRTENFRELLIRKFSAPARAFVGQTKKSEFPAKSQAQQNEHFWALRDVSFDVPEGQVVGIIGRNGAGKSTLLKILSRITDPTIGSVVVRGRMASLLEVGTGFHPELTGRENIFLNGAILGMHKAEIVSKFDEIVAFAEVDQFLDTAVKHYSSGMYVRLAFAVAAHLNPEILIVDEVLAVGDMAFQKKCLGKMSEVSRGGRTVLFVSHNMAAVENLCSRVILLEHGQLVFEGTAKETVQRYMNGLSGGRSSDGHIVNLDDARDRRSVVGKLLKQVEFYTEGDQPIVQGLQIGESLKVRVHFELPKPTSSFDIGLGFNNLYGQRVFTAHTRFEPNRWDDEHVGMQTLVCEIPSLTFTPGEYILRIWLDIGNSEADLINDAGFINVIESDYYGTGKSPWNGAFVLKHNWYLEKKAEAK